MRVLTTGRITAGGINLRCVSYASRYGALTAALPLEPGERAIARAYRADLKPAAKSLAPGRSRWMRLRASEFLALKRALACRRSCCEMKSQAVTYPRSDPRGIPANVRSRSDKDHFRRCEPLKLGKSRQKGWDFFDSIAHHHLRPVQVKCALQVKRFPSCGRRKAGPGPLVPLLPPVYLVT